MKTLIMIGLHKQTHKDVPASIMKIYEDNSKDSFDEQGIASSEQIYARKYKRLDYARLSIDDFNGSKGIAETFYNANQLYEFIDMIMEDGYELQRMTRYKENKLADTLFNHVERNKNVLLGKETHLTT